MIDELINELTAARLDVSEVAGTINVRKGTGPLARAVNLDPDPFLQWLTARPDATRRRDIASWANGVLTTMLEPKRSDARSWTFVEAAGSILPTVEGPGFTQGVQAATGGESAWTLPLEGELVVGWVLRLSNGIRPLTAEHVAQWGATEDRIVSAGRSLLYHKTRDHRWAETDRSPVLQLAVGDGHDAARLLVAADVYFTELDHHWRFAIPHPDVVLAVRTADDREALEDEALRRYADANYPLDTRVWRLTARGPVVEDE